MKHSFVSVLLFSTLLLFGQLSQANSDRKLPPNKDTMKSLNITMQVPEKPTVIEQSWHLTKADSTQIISASINDQISVDGFPITIYDAKSNRHVITKPITLKRYQVMAPGAKITVIGLQGEYQINPPELMAFSAPGQGVGLMVDPKTGDVKGMYNRAGVSMTISGNLQTGLDFRHNQEGMPVDANSNQCLTQIADQPAGLMEDLRMDLMSKTLVKNNRGVIDYETVVAVDTDNEWMAGKSNNNTVAMNYILSLFVNMNVFMERDLSLRLLIGNVYLRTTPDPYPTVSDIFDSLNDFGEHWRVNNDAVNRDFVVLLSGQNINPFSFSGIAWINQYCENGFLQAGGTQTVGSYSVNRIGASLSTGFTAQFLAHELGHNLGSPHTHCYIPNVDSCYNAEGGCYAGAVSCPAGGSGTIMSYCHFGPPSGADCGLNDEEFHPAVIGLLSSRIVSNFPACIDALGSDLIFEDGFNN